MGNENIRLAEDQPSNYGNNAGRFGFNLCKIRYKKNYCNNTTVNLGNGRDGIATASLQEQRKPSFSPPRRGGEKMKRTALRLRAALSHTRMFPLPASLEKDPLVVPSLPMSGNPYAMRTRRVHPSPGNPHVVMTARSPAIVPGDPYNFPRRPYNYRFRRGGRGTDVNADANVQLCKCRHSDRKRSRKYRCFHKCFHILFPSCN